MTRKELAADIIAELSFSNALPCRVNDAEVSRIIDMAVKHFYTHVKDAKEPASLIIEKGNFTTDKFKSTRRLVLPDCIYTVDEVRDHQMPLSQSMTYGAIGLTGLIGAEMWLAPYSQNTLPYVASVQSFFDSTSAFMKTSYLYDYNYNTKTLIFDGKLPCKDDICCHVSKVIPEHKLFEDQLFQRYVRVLGKRRNCQLLSIVQKFPLPGGVILDYSDIKDITETELKLIESEMSDSNIHNFVIMSANH